MSVIYRRRIVSAMVVVTPFFSFSSLSLSLLLPFFFLASPHPGGGWVMQFDPREVDLITSSSRYLPDWGMCCFCSRDLLRRG